MSESPLGVVEPIKRVQRPHRQLGIGRIDQYREFDFRGGDGADVDIARGEGGKRLGSDARMAAHAAADHGDFRYICGAIEPGVADFALGRGDGIARPDVIGGRYREGEVGRCAVLRDVLHDHIDVDTGVRERAEDRGSDARLVLNLADGNLGFVLGKGDAGNDVAFHNFLLAADQGAPRGAVRVDVLGLLETGADEYRHVVHHAEFHRTDLKHLGTLRGQFQHVLERDFIEPSRLWHYTRVGGVDAVDDSVDIATVGVNGRRDRHRGGIRTAASKRGDSLVLRTDALETGDHGNFLAIFETLDQLSAVDLENTRRSVGVTGLYRDLPALPRARLNAEPLQHDCQKSRRHLFTRRYHRVVFAGVMHRGRLTAPFDQLIGLACHRGNHDGDVMACIHLALDVACHVANTLNIGDRCAAEFH